jgi:nitrogen fixation protein FixH
MTHPRPLTGRTVLFCLLGFFGVVVLVNAIMIRAAVSTFGGVETASSYQAGLAFARDAAAARAQDERHWQVKANVRAAADSVVVEIDARDAAGRPLTGLEASVVLHHPTDRRADQVVAVNEGAAGHFRGTAVRFAGQRDLLIEFSRGGERLFRSQNRVILQ